MLFRSGQDLALIDNKTHNSSFDDLYALDKREVKSNESAPRVKSVDGNMLETKSGYLIFKRNIEEIIEKNPQVTFYNCSKGAMIQGTVAIEFNKLNSNSLISSKENLENLCVNMEKLIIELKKDLNSKQRDKFIEELDKNIKEQIEYLTEIRKERILNINMLYGLINNVLKAYENSDMILVDDILKYEILEYLEDMYSKYCEIEKNIDEEINSIDSEVFLRQLKGRKIVILGSLIDSEYIDKWLDTMKLESKCIINSIYKKKGNSKGKEVIPLIEFKGSTKDSFFIVAYNKNEFIELILEDNGFIEKNDYIYIKE